MIDEVAARRAEVAALCGQFGVGRLDVFGSAARGADFGPDSDVDLLVTYDEAAAPSLGSFLGLRDALAALFGRNVDLVVDGVVRNAFVRAGIERSRQRLHGA